MLLNGFKSVSAHYCLVTLKEREQRLKNLIESDACSADNLKKYHKELIQLSEETADPIKSRK